METLNNHLPAKAGISLGWVLNLLIGASFFVVGVGMVVLLNREQRKEALIEAEAKARILLDRNLATHAYFSQTLKPHLLQCSAAFRSTNYFDPTWMSSSYALREIGKRFAVLNAAHYYLKDAAVNARNPENEADAAERAFLEEVKRDPKLELRSGLSAINGEPFFTVMRRGEPLEKSCLQCHGSKDAAPAELVKTYGPDRSFGRREGEVVSIVSLRVPLRDAYAEADRFSLKLATLLLVTVGGIFLVQLAIQRRFFLAPLNRVRRQALEIAGATDKLGAEVPLPPGRELRELTAAFNRMSATLKQEHDLLEQRVGERTAQLAQANEQLMLDNAQRQLAEQEKQRLIEELQAAAAKVKTLSGLLPICSSCKKIRDDHGYWNQLESYIAQHSGARFTHGVCPECALKFFPEIPRGEGEPPKPR